MFNYRIKCVNTSFLCELCSYLKCERMFNEKLYPTTFTEKQTTSISATRSHYIGANPLTFTVHVMGTLN